MKILFQGQILVTTNTLLLKKCLEYKFTTDKIYRESNLDTDKSQSVYLVFAIIISARSNMNLV